MQAGVCDRSAVSEERGGAGAFELVLGREDELLFRGVYRSARKAREDG